MSGSIETAVKLATLETDLKHLTKAVETLTTQVETLTTLLERSRGAIWVIAGITGTLGFVASKVAAAVPWASLAPR